MNVVRQKLSELRQKRYECERRIGRARKHAKRMKNALVIMFHEHEEARASWEYYRLSNKIEVLEEILKEENKDV